MKRSLVWKLSATLFAIVMAVILVSGYLNSLVSEHYSLDSVRNVLHFNSKSILQGIGKLMMSRNKEGVEELISDIAADSSVYGRVRLVSHYSGEVVASREGEAGPKLAAGDAFCLLCHDRKDSAGAGMGSLDHIVDLPEGGRLLSVVTPVANAESCQTAECHAHDESGPILGLLQVDYSLASVDAQFAGHRNTFTLLALVSGVALAGFVWLALDRLIGKPVRRLTSGTERIAGGDLDFRFPVSRSDEIGRLEEAFNAMTQSLRRHQSDLREAKEYLEGIIENSADLIITVNPEGRIETFNKGAENVLGYRREEVVGQPIEMLFADPSERETAIAKLEYTDNVRNYETRFLARDGRPRDVLLTLSRLRDPDGAAIGTFGISKDISREKRMQEQLVESEKYAAIGHAVTGIQHATKNMLNAVRGGAYLVRKGMEWDDREQVREGCAMVEEGCDRILALSKSMLNYARRWTPALEEVDLPALLNQVCRMAEKPAGERGASVRREIPDSFPTVRCDPKLIHMAVTDLVINALDACAWKEYAAEEAPEVVVALSEQKDRSVIEVRDNGCGMDEGVRRNVFTPFFSTKNEAGTGLGLALTLRIVHAHEGSITVESKPGRGSAFRLVLPISGPARATEVSDGQEGADH